MKNVMSNILKHLKIDSIKPVSVYKSIKRFGIFVQKIQLDVYSAGAAFYIFISLIPLFIAVLSIVPYTPVTQADIMRLAGLFPEDVDIVVQVLTAEAYVKSAARLWIALVIALWSAARGVMFITKGLNRIVGVRERRNYFVLRIYATIYTLLIVVSIVVLMVMGVFERKILAVIYEHLPEIPKHINVPLFTIINLRGLITVLILFVLFMFVYTVLPARKMEFRKQIPGALLCALLWWLFTVLFSTVVDNFGGFSMYGSMATVIACMLWIYFCVYILFLGATLNNYLTFYITLNRIIGE